MGPSGDCRHLPAPDFGQWHDPCDYATDSGPLASRSGAPYPREASAGSSMRRGRTMPNRSWSHQEMARATADDRRSQTAWDLVVRIECPRDLRLRRGIQRDGEAMRWKSVV